MAAGDRFTVHVKMEGIRENSYRVVDNMIKEVADPIWRGINDIRRAARVATPVVQGNLRASVFATAAPDGKVESDGAFVPRVGRGLPTMPEMVGQHSAMIAAHKVRNRQLMASAKISGVAGYSAEYGPAVHARPGYAFLWTAFMTSYSGIGREIRVALSRAIARMREPGGAG